jgi:hypothetical protein
VGLLGYDTGQVAADPQGQVGTGENPVRAVHTESLAGGLTDGSPVDTLAGEGLSITDGALTAPGGSGDGSLTVSSPVSDSRSGVSELVFDRNLVIESDGDGTVTIDATDSNTDTDTHTDISYSGTTVVGDTDDVNFGNGLDATDDGDGTATVDVSASGSTVQAEYVTLSTDDDLDNDRTLAGAGGITLTDNGANGDPDVGVDTSGSFTPTWNGAHTFAGSPAIELDGSLDAGGNGLDNVGSFDNGGSAISVDDDLDLTSMAARTSSNRSAGDRSVSERAVHSALTSCSDPTRIVPSSMTVRTSASGARRRSTRSTSSVPSAAARSALSPKKASLYPGSPGSRSVSTTATSTSLAPWAPPRAREPKRIPTETRCSVRTESTVSRSRGSSASGSTDIVRDQTTDADKHRAPRPNRLAG